MGSEWTEEKLGNVIELKRGYDLPQQNREPGDIPIVSSSGISGIHSEPKVKAPGVVTGRYGTIGEVFFLNKDFWPLNTTLYVRDFKGNDPLFVSYLLRTIDYQSCSDKGAVPGVNRNHLHELKVRVPLLPVQKAIARILGTLDDKIELNRRMNETLEAMARALFKSWFVDFGPVRAKQQGGPPANLDPATADLFPDEFEDSELGEIPKGWKVERFEEHLAAERGLSYKGSGLCADRSGLPMHNLNSIYEGGGYKHEGIKYYAGEYRDKHLLNAGDMIITNTEQGHEHRLIGFAAIVPNCYGPTGLFSHHIYRVQPLDTSPFNQHYLAQLFNSQRWHKWIAGFSNGTSINMLPQDALRMPLLVVPPDELIRRFSEFAAEAHTRKENNIAESHTLAALRDALLPRLLCGDLSINSTSFQTSESASKAISK